MLISWLFSRTPLSISFELNFCGKMSRENTALLFLERSDFLALNSKKKFQFHLTSFLWKSRENIASLRLITTQCLCNQSPLNFHHFCLTRFHIEGRLELIGTPSVDILHQLDCAWLCCLLSQCKSCAREVGQKWPKNVRHH